MPAVNVTLNDQIRRVNEMLRDGLYIQLRGDVGVGHDWGLTLNDRDGQVKILGIGTQKEISLLVDGMREALDIVGR